MTQPFQTTRRAVLGGLAVGLALPGTMLCAQSQTPEETTMSGPVLYALYPQPTDAPVSRPITRRISPSSMKRPASRSRPRPTR